MSAGGGTSQPSCRGSPKNWISWSFLCPFICTSQLGEVRGARLLQADDIDTCSVTVLGGRGSALTGVGCRASDDGYPPQKRTFRHCRDNVIRPAFEPSWLRNVRLCEKNKKCYKSNVFWKAHVTSIRGCRSCFRRVSNLHDR